MKFIPAARQVALVFAVILEAACGGGGDIGSREAAGPGGAAAGQLSAAPPMAVPASPTAGQLMDWAELAYPQFFPMTAKVDAFEFPFTYRYYPLTQNYLGVSTASDDVAVYIYGEVAGWQLQRVGALSDFTCRVLPQNCVAGGAGTLMGHTVSTTDFHGTAPDHTLVLGPHQTVVGDGIELVNGFEGFSVIDFSAASIRIIAATNQPFGYFELLRFTDANGTISPIASVTVDPATNYAGFDASRVSFTAGHIEVNMTGLSGQQGQQVLLNITFAQR